MSKDISEALRHMHDVITGLEMQVTFARAAQFLPPGTDLDGAIILGAEEPDFAVIDEAASCDAIPNDNAFDAIADAHFEELRAAAARDYADDDRVAAWEVAR